MGVPVHEALLWGLAFQRGELTAGIAVEKGHVNTVTVSD